MTSLPITALAVSAAAFYLAVVYFLFFLKGFSGNIFHNINDDLCRKGILIWPVFLPIVISVFTICGIISIWESIPFPKPIKDFCHRSLHALSLPFRPVYLGRSLRQRYNLH